MSEVKKSPKKLEELSEAIKKNEGIDILEDDDDFDEFNIEGSKKEDKPQQSNEAIHWIKEWEDEEIDDDFSAQLKQELLNAANMKP